MLVDVIVVEVVAVVELIRSLVKLEVKRTKTKKRIVLVVARRLIVVE